MLPNAGSTGAIVSGVGVVAGYLIFLWRVFKRNPGNRLVECGAITMIIFLALVPFSRIPGFTDKIPDWIFVLYILLVVLPSFATLFFLAQRIWRGLIQGEKQ